MSDRPSRPSQFVQAVDRSGKWVSANKSLTALISALTALGTMLTVAWTQYTALSTDAERTRAIEVYDHGYEGALDGEDWRKGGIPAKTRKKVDQVDTIVQQTRAEQLKRDDDLRKLWWWQTGYSATEKEPCDKLKAAAAAHAREQFEAILKENPETSFEVAYRKALNEPWYERRRLAGRGCR